jgi:SPX domain protein involved in polyphosphate accumulation
LKRLELKYLITQEQYRRIVFLVSQHAKLDKACEDGRPYSVHSTYFDTPQFDFYMQKKDGLPTRRKYRFRTYGNESEQGFFEIKYREDSSVYKQRFSFLRSTWLDILQLSDDKSDFKTKTAQVSYDMVHRILIGQHLAPTHLIQYKRLAYIAHQEESFRITFDFDLRTANIKNHVLSDENPHKVFNSYIVMELKPSTSLPVWCYQILKEFKLVKQSISKYAITLEKLGVLEL